MDVHGAGIHYGDVDDEISQEDCWTVVSAFFQEKGLVSQQLDSFNEFMMHNMQEVIWQTRPVEFRPKRQYTSDADAVDEVRVRCVLCACCGEAPDPCACVLLHLRY